MELPTSSTISVWISSTCRCCNGSLDVTTRKSHCQSLEESFRFSGYPVPMLWIERIPRVCTYGLWPITSLWLITCTPPVSRKQEGLPVTLLRGAVCVIESHKNLARNLAQGNRVASAHMDWLCLCQPATYSCFNIAIHSINNTNPAHWHFPARSRSRS